MDGDHRRGAAGASRGRTPSLRTDIRVRGSAARRAAGARRARRTLSLNSVSAVKVAIDARGDLVVGWTEYRVDVQAVYRPWVLRVPRAGHPPLPSCLGRELGAFLEDVAMTPDGTAVVTWMELRLDPVGATLPRRMLLRRVLDDGSLSAVTDLQMTGLAADVVAGDQSFWVAGSVGPMDNSGPDDGIGVVRVDRRGRVVARRTLDPGATTDEPSLERPLHRLTLDAREDARVLWIRADRVNGGNEIVGRVWRANGSAGRETVLRSGPCSPPRPSPPTLAATRTSPGSGSTASTTKASASGAGTVAAGSARAVLRADRLGQELRHLDPRPDGVGRRRGSRHRRVGPPAREHGDHRRARGPIVTRVRRIRPDGRTSRDAGARPRSALEVVRDA